MYVRKTTRRRLHRAGFLLLALVVLTPKFDLGSALQLTTLLSVAGLESAQAG